MSWMRTIKEDLYQRLEAAALSAKEKGLLNLETVPAFTIEIPREKSHGDFAGNIAMLLAKQARMAPRKIAEIIVSELDQTGSFIEQVEIAGAGFINFRLQKKWLTEG